MSAGLPLRTGESATQRGSRAPRPRWRRPVVATGSEKSADPALVCGTCGGRGVGHANLRRGSPVARDMNPRLEGQEWLVLLDQDNRSRMSTREVQGHVQAGKLARETLVWRGGMSAWASISSIAEFGLQSSAPTGPRRQMPAGYNPRFAETVISSHRAAQHGQRPAAPSPRLCSARGGGSRRAADGVGHLVRAVHGGRLPGGQRST